MRSYDHKHPKGRKFSTVELIAQRDAWYEKHDKSGGGTATPEHRDLDRAVFRRIGTRLPYDTVVARIDGRYAGQPYHRGQLDPLSDYLEDCRDPSVEFLDSDLEAARAALTAAIAEYQDFVLSNVFVSDDRTELVIHPEMKYRDPERYYAVVHEISRKEGLFIDSYRALVRLARRKLAIDLPLVSGG